MKGYRLNDYIKLNSHSFFSDKRNNLVDWPDYFPENCPPQNARRDNLKVYRLVDNDPPRQNDFVPNKLLYPHINYSGETLCLVCGISVDKNQTNSKKV